MAPLEKIEELRRKGLQVSDNLTKEEYQRLERELNPPKPPKSDEELARIYRRYAALKGWSTHDRVVGDKILEWRSCKDGPVQLAIDFDENGVDGAKYLGYDAESRAADASDRILQLAVIVAGTEHCNEDGTSRKQIIERCEQFEQLTLIHEPDNPHDQNAIKVCRNTEEQLGYIPRKTAAEIVDRVQRGFWHCAYFREKAQRYGTEEARIILIICQPGVTSAELTAYCQRWIQPRERRA